MVKSLCLVALLSLTTFAQANDDRFAGAKATASAGPQAADEDRTARPLSSLPPEFGKESELKGITKIYVGSGDLEARKLIIKELAKEARLVVTERTEDADLLLSFQSAAQANGATLTPFGSVRANVLAVGELGAMVRAGLDDEGKRKVRVLWSSRKAQQWAGGLTLSRHPAVNAAREFVKVWQRENPKEKK